MPQQVFEGRWEEVSSAHSRELCGKLVRVEVVDTNGIDRAFCGEAQPKGQMFFGMFSGHPQPTEEDFRSAEYHTAPDWE
jgi:hypothetical protein